jgi:hypothetical protein
MDTVKQADCGLYVPTRAELDAQGVERYEVHPKMEGRKTGVRVGDAALIERLMLAAGFVGRRITLPASTPQTWPPHDFATKRWSDRTKRQVARIKRKAPGIICSTYAGHGRTGERWGIDAWVSRIHQKANAAEEDAGDRLCEWIIRNWTVIRCNYVIWWNWMNDGAGWFDYEPWRRTGSGSQELVTSRHLDHLHITVDNPHVAGNE